MKDKRYQKKQVLYFLYRGVMWTLWLLMFWNILMFFNEVLWIVKHRFREFLIQK